MKNEKDCVVTWTVLSHMCTEEVADSLGLMDGQNCHISRSTCSVFTDYTIMFVMCFLSTGCFFYHILAGFSNKNPSFATTSSASYHAQCNEIRDTL